MADTKYLLPIIQSLKNDLVSARHYEAAKHIRDAERLLLPQGSPSIEKRIEKMERFIDGSSMGCAEMSQRIEKMEKNPLANFVHISDDGQAVLDASMLPTFDVIVKSSDAFKKMEKALSGEMARTREMDDILAGVVKRVGYVSEDPKKPEWVDRYFQGTDPVADSGISKFASATWGQYIDKAELIKWLDAEIAMSTEKLEAAEQSKMVVATNIAQAMLATYRAVKAHITG
jgi:hypothetical protein